MRFLVDSSLPASVGTEAPPDFELVRWRGRYLADEEFVREAAVQQCRAAVVLGRNSLDQPSVRDVCAELGVGMVAVEAPDPFEAKDRLLRHLPKLRAALAKHEFVVIFANEVRPLGTAA